MISQPAPPRLHVALAFDAGATPAFEAAVAEEAARVWAPYGIALEESPADSPGHSRTITLHVAMAQTRAVQTVTELMDSFARAEGQQPS